MQSKRILVVEDERAIRDMICCYLRGHGFAVSEADDSDSAQQLLREKTPDLVVLERALPASDGLDLAKSVRSSQRRWLPLLMIASRACENDKVEALEAGVDDILGKPFSPRELLARIHALLRCCERRLPRSYDSNAGLLLDAARQSVMYGDSSIELGPTDFRLLTFFVQHPERAHTRTELLKHVWGGESRAEPRTVDVQVQRLRGALAPLGIRQLIQTVQGIGYRFSVCRAK